MSSSSRRSAARLSGDIALILLIVSVSALVLLHGARPTQAGEAVALPAPSDTSLDALRPPPTALQLLSAQIAALDAIGDAIDAGIAACPEVPWGQFGLADVEIRPGSVRFDEDRGRYISEVGDGRIAVLTLDPGIQRRVQAAMRRANEPGEATVVMDPKTGQVLAIADDGDEEMGRGLARRSYAWAASIFKVITAASLFEHSGVTPRTQTCYSGGGDGFNEDSLRDDAARDSLCISFERAMGLSANVVFGKLADRHLSPERLLRTAEDFAFNAQIPFEMPVEPSRIKLPSERVDFAMAAAGFRHSRLSPLHGALIQAAIANDGIMMVPTMVERVEDAHGKVLWTHTPVVWREVTTPARAQQLRDVQASTCTTGTARADFNARPGWPAAIRVWGKTGTLLNRRLDGTLPTQAFTYRWFTGIAQRAERELVVSSLVVQNPTWEIRGTYLASEAVLGGLPASP